jgi:predicted metal-dependent hydrolase
MGASEVAGSAAATPGLPAPEAASDGPVTGAGAAVEIRRSRRRRRTVTAYREAGRTVVLIPAGFSGRQEREWVEKMLDRLAAKDRRRRPADPELKARAAALSARYLGGRAVPSSVAWVANQNARWGSTTPLDGTIRLSDRLQGMPAWVIDYVLLHELAHLLHPGHGPEFWALLEDYPRTERARGFLEGVTAARAVSDPARPPG